MTNEDDDYNDDKYSNNGNDDDNNFYSSTYFKNKIHMNDYTNLKSDSLHSKYTQNKLVRNIPKSCLRQYFQSQSQKDSMCQPKCPIENPFQSQKGHGSWWKKALNMNEQLINDYLGSIKTNANAGGNNDAQTGDNTDNKIPNKNKNKNKDMLDIVFYGDSITEHWNGRSMGDFGKSLEEMNTVFQKYFNPFPPTSAKTSSRNDDVNGSNDDDDDDDGIEKLKALALGIAGDKTTNLLYRIQKNDGNENANMNDDYDDGENKSGVELPDELQAKVFWLLIGTNDLSYNCAEDVVLLGILSIVEELRLKRPNSIVVVNGLLPRTNDVNGRLIHRYSNDGDEKNLDENENEHYSDDSEDSEDSADSATSEDNDDDDDLNNDDASTSTTVTTNTNSSSNETENDEKTRRRTNKIENKKVFDYWPSIQAINYQLKQYAKKNDKVEFFDPSHLFVAQMGNEFYKRNESFLMKELQYDYLHPSAFGHEVWAKVCECVGIS
jgi:lysophospholipase L1-like esterase